MCSWLRVMWIIPAWCVHEHTWRVPDCELCEVLLFHVFMNIPDVFLIVSCVKYSCFMCSWTYLTCSWLWVVWSNPVSCVHEHTWRVPDCELCEVLLLHVFMNIPDVFLTVSCVKYFCYMCSWTYLTCSWLWVVWSTPVSCVHEHTWRVPDCELCEVILFHVFMNIPDVFLTVSCVKYSCYMCSWTYLMCSWLWVVWSNPVSCVHEHTWRVPDCELCEVLLLHVFMNIPDVFLTVSCVKYFCYMCSWTYLTCSWLWVVWSTPVSCVHEHTWRVSDCELCEVILLHVFMNIPDVFLTVSCVKYSCFMCSWTYLTCSWLWVVWSTPATCVHEHTWRVPDCELCEVLLFHVFMNIPDVFLTVSCVKYSCYMCSWTYLTCSWLWVVWSTPVSCVHEHTWRVPDCELCEVLLFHVFMNIPDVFLTVSCVKYSCFMCSWTYLTCSWLWVVWSTPVSCVHEHTWRVPDCELCEVLLFHVFMNIPDVFLIVSCVKYSCFMCSWTYLTCSWLWVVWSTPASCVHEHTWRVPDCELCEVLLLHVFMNIPDVFLTVSCVKYSCYMCSWTYLTCSWLWVVWSTPATCVHEHTWCVPDCELCEVLLFHVFMNIPDVFLIVSCVK